MDDTTGFSSYQSACSLLDDVQRDGERHRSITPHTRFESLAFDQLHRVKTLAILLTVISHSSHIWVADVRRSTRFAVAPSAIPSTAPPTTSDAWWMRTCTLLAATIAAIA